MATAIAPMEDMSPPAVRRGRPRTSMRNRSAVVLAAVVFAVAMAGCMPGDARTFLDRTNALRSSQGIAPLHEEDTLTNKAEAWAQHMASTGVLAHSSLSAGLGGLPWRSLGENVGVSSPTGDTLLSIHNAFVGSSYHRANLLNRGFTNMGVGVAQDRYGRIWVAQVFASLPQP